MATMKRRKFINNSLITSAGLTAGMSGVSKLIPQQVLGANERVSIALLGCGGRGNYVARGMIEEGAEISFICDLNDERLDQSEKFLAEVQKKKIQRAKDMRKIFDAKDVDAVIVATPDHWHAPASIMACQAGKDVYVEKPHAHNIWESRKLIEAARKYNRLIQAGTQNRSAAYNLAALEYVKSGKLGKIGLVKVYNLKPGHAFMLGEPGTLPREFDWDAWLGPAAKRDYHQHIFSGGWHHYWDFSGGDLADDGIHQLDLALMMMGNPPIPKSASCTGGRLIFSDDDSEVPDVQIAAYDFENFVLTFELTLYPRYMRKTEDSIRRNDVLPYWTQNATRIELYGSELMMTIGRHGGGWQVTTSGGKVVEQMYGRPADFEHDRNFLECVKSRKRPSASIEIAHNACVMIHMANIAQRLGNKTLKFDRNNENFIGDEQANTYLKRKYREGYEIPETV